MINDSSKPLILIGSNSALWLLKEICELHKVDIHGIIDSNYYGNTAEISGIPVIDTEEVFDDPLKLEYYKKNFNFFLATNYIPDQSSVQKYNLEKRNKLIKLIDMHDLPCISFVDPTARVHHTNKIGKNVIIDALCYISPENVIGDYSSFFAATMIGYHNVIGRSVVFQRHAGVMHYNSIGDNVYIGLHSQVCGDKLTIATGTHIHPCMAIKRSTTENEVISLAGRDLRKVYTHYTIEE